MKFNVEIKNFGKLRDVEVNVNRFTVLAGPNNSGKSLTSKFLYSIFNAMGSNHVEAHISNLMERVNFEFGFVLSRRERPKDSASASALLEEFEQLAGFVEDSPYRNNEELEKFISELTQRINNLQSKYELFETENDSADMPRNRDLVADIATSLNRLRESVEASNAANMIANGMKSELERNILGNFQAANFSQLSERESFPIAIDIENVGCFKFADEQIELDLEEAWHEHVLHFSTLVYMESPIFWKLKRPLEDFRFFPERLSFRRQRISGVPLHFHDLCRNLKYEFEGEIDFPDVYNKLVGDLGGKLAISKDGILSFQENDRSVPLAQAAAGVANIGFLALLIERKVLDKNSFIFIDEPEAHLHPCWQVLMAECLFQLAKSGAHVVIATHSVEILKWLEVWMRSHPDDETLLALNQFSPLPVDNESSDDFQIKLAKIIESLTDPFAELYLKSI